MKNLKVIVAFAADHLDREANKATLEDRVDDLSKLNQRVHSGDELFKLWAEAKGGRAIAMGKGDGIVEVGADHLEELSQLKEQYNQEVGSTCSIGVGVKLSEAEKALTYAQRTGGNSIDLFTEELEQELATLHEPEGEEKLFNAFFDKAEAPVDKRANSLNPSTVKNAGGGMTGPSEPLQTGPDTPAEPEPAPDEMSENLAMQQAVAGAGDALGQFSQLAEQSEQKEGEEKQAKADEAQEGEDQENLRGAVVEVLKQFKEQAPLWEQLKDAQPDAYKTLTGVIQAMVALARKAFMDEDGEGGEEGGEQEAQPVQKSELPLAPAKHNTVEGFLGQMKAMPREGPARGKFITSHMNHAPFLQALQAHPQGKQVHAMLTGFLNSKANAGVGVGAKTMVKALPRGARLDALNPGDQTHNQANLTGFLNHPVAQDKYLEGTGAQVLPGPTEIKNPVKWSVDPGEKWTAQVSDRSRATINGIVAANYSSHPGTPEYIDGKPIGEQLVSQNTEGMWENKPTVDVEPNDPSREHYHWSEVKQHSNMMADANSIHQGVPAPDRQAWANSPIMKRKMTKAALEAGKTGRHQVVLPVNTQLDASASADRNRVGRIKILDRNTGKTKWRQTRAGIVQDPMGNPTSSRNPTGGVKPDQVVH